MVYGSDRPPVPILLRRHTAVAHNLPLAREDKATILGLNAAGLLKLSSG